MKYRCILCNHAMTHLSADGLGRDCRLKLAAEPFNIDRSATLALRNLHQHIQALAWRSRNCIEVAANEARVRLGISA